MAEKVMLAGDYEGLSLWKSSFETKDGKKINSLGGTLIVNGNIPDGEYYVNVYKNEEKKTEKSPDYTLYLKPKESSGQKTTDIDDVDDF